MQCKKCGAIVPEGKYCLNCGWDQEKMVCEPSLRDVYTHWKRRRFRKLSKKGREGYENAWRFLSPFADFPITSLGLPEYQSIMDSQAHLSKSHQQKIQQLISHICKQATLMGYLHINYASFLELDGYESKPYIPFSDQEIRILFSAVSDPTWGETARVILILIFTGWRPEELFSLKQEQVNLDECYMISGSKTDAGKNRIVPIVSPIFPFVLALYYQTAPGDYLVKSPHGKRICIQNWRIRKFYPCLLHLGINTPDDPHRVKPYSTRHTFATLAYRAGVKSELLTKMIGHTNFDFTMHTYVHNTASELSEETQKIALYFKNLFESEEAV